MARMRARLNEEDLRLLTSIEGLSGGKETFSIKYDTNP